MYKRKNVYRGYIIRPIIIGIASIVAYLFFLLAGTHEKAVFFDSLYFIGTDWLAMFMFIFAVGYTGITIKFKKNFMILFGFLCGIDSISLLLNNIFYHMYDLVLMKSASGIEYWGNEFGFNHYIHLSLCYVMVGLTFFYFAKSIKKAPAICKTKYIGILIVYIIVIIANLICYSLNMIFDISVILYGVLAAFICYYSTYRYPHKLLLQTLKAVNDAVSDAILFFDASGKCLYANKKAQEIFESNNEFEPFLAEAYAEKWEEQVKGNKYAASGEECFRNNGREYHYTVEYRKEFYSNQRIGSYIKLMDFTEDFVSYRKERYVATHDIFTGTLNRAGFFEEVDKLIEEKGTFGYVMLSSNVRDFKIINEMFGEKLGDDVILKQAGILKTFSHPETIYARICDDKFALYTKREFFKEKEFVEYIKMMQKVLDKPLYQLRIVVGVYQPQGRIESAQVMYDKALVASTQISNKYNETFAYYDTILMEKILNEKIINEDFKEAIISHQMEMYLQPIVDSDGKYCGAEALSRWHHPKRGLLLPCEFLDILEKSGLIYQLDSFMWEEAARTLRRWADMGIQDHFISVNVSVKDFFYTDIYKIFTRLVETYDIKPENFHVEITEFVLMSDFAKAYSMAYKMQSAGFVVAIDNFGDGYSSLNMLKDFHAAELKIGISLLDNIVTSERNRVILQAIIEMAASLDIDVIAEGVETEEQYEILKNSKCNYYQGNYIAEPKTVSEYEEMLFH